MLVFFTKLRLACWSSSQNYVMEFQVRYLALFLLLSVIDGFKCFWMGILYKNTQLILEFLKTLFLVLHFSYYTLLTFLLVLSVILLSMLMILLSILSLIRDLICGNKNNWHLIYEAPWSGADSGLLISMLEKLNWFCLMWKWMGLFLRENKHLRCSGWLSFLNWIEAFTLSILLKLDPEVALYLCKSTIHPSMKYCCQVRAGVPTCYLALLDKLQKQICRTLDPSLATSLERLAYCQNVASLSLFYNYYFVWCSSGSMGSYSDELHDCSVTIPRCYKDVCINCFFPCTASLWNSLPTECFPLTYDLNGFKSGIDRHLLTVGSFKRYLMYALISFSCNSMPCSGCSALHGVNPN